MVLVLRVADGADGSFLALYQSELAGIGSIRLTFMALALRVMCFQLFSDDLGCVLVLVIDFTLIGVAGSIRNVVSHVHLLLK